MTRPSTASAFEVFAAFLRLGLTSFGGPIAHLGYFRNEFVGRLRWLDERPYADLVALCQFLPGPASSQVGFALGLQRAGWRGGLAAWFGFTLPSALVLAAFALGPGRAGEGHAALGGALHALKVVAVAVVAQAVWTMARSLCPDWQRRALAVLAAALVLGWPGAAAQVVALAACAAAGGLLRSAARASPAGDGGDCGVGRQAGIVALVAFFALLLGLPLLAAMTGQPWLQVIEAFYRAGALVFGGGHVVLPLLQAGVVEPGWVDASTFLAGYGAAQAVPGPLFTFAAYLGSVIGSTPGGPFGALSGGAAGAFAGAAACLAALFLPGILMLVAALPFWLQLRARPALRSALAGANAGVVGVLAAALIDPVWPAAIRGGPDLALGVLCLVLLVGLRWPPLAVVVLAASLGAIGAIGAAA